MKAESESPDRGEGTLFPPIRGLQFGIMSRRWAGLRSAIWLVIGIGVGLMSGIASLVREWLSIFHPQAVNSGRLFNASLITCFFAAVLFVFYRQRATIASLQEAQDQRQRVQQLRVDFGYLMTEGERLAVEWRAGIREYGPWLQKCRDWVQRVSDFLTNMGLPDEAAAFRHAGEGDPDINQLQGPNQAVYWHRFYGGQLDRRRAKLAEIAARRLDFHL